MNSTFLIAFALMLVLGLSRIGRTNALKLFKLKG